MKRKLVANADEHIYDYDKFHLLPIDRLGDNSKHITAGYKESKDQLVWTIGRGGHGLSDYEWTLSIYYPEGRYETWVFPPFISTLFKKMGEWGKDDLRNELRRLLEVDK